MALELILLSWTGAKLGCSSVLPVGLGIESSRNSSFRPWQGDKLKMDIVNVTVHSAATFCDSTIGDLFAAHL